MVDQAFVFRLEAVLVLVVNETAWKRAPTSAHRSSAGGGPDPESLSVPRAATIAAIAAQIAAEPTITATTPKSRASRPAINAPTGTVAE